jgi:Flp pilus assembly pilin Flp
MQSIFNLISDLLADESGLTSTEYSTMGGAMAGGVFSMSDQLSSASGAAIDGVSAAVSGTN